MGPAQGNDRVVTEYHYRRRSIATRAIGLDLSMDVRPGHPSADLMPGLNVHQSGMLKSVQDQRTVNSTPSECLLTPMTASTEIQAYHWRMFRIGGVLIAMLLSASCTGNEPPGEVPGVASEAPNTAEVSEIELARDVREGASSPDSPVSTTVSDIAIPLELASEDDGASTPTVVEKADLVTTTSPDLQNDPPATTTSTTTTPPAIDDCESVPENCVQAGEDFSNRDLNSAVFFEAEISGVNFANSNLADSDFSGSLAIGTNFSGAVLTDAIIEGADFTGSDFTNANLTDAFVFDTVLNRVIWSNTTCPDGTNSDDNGGTCEGTF